MADIELVIKISNYDKEWITNGYYIPEEINTRIAETIANGTPILDNATNERMIGKWIKSRDSYGTNHFTCPFCEHDIATRNADNWDDNYCSNCGARMEGVEYEKGYTL